MDSSDYLRRVLGHHPIGAARAIVRDRGLFLGHPAEVERPDSGTRRRIVDLLGLLRRHFWGDDAHIYRDQLLVETMAPFPDLEARFQWLERVWQVRAQFLEARGSSRIDAEFLEYLAQVLIAPRDQAIGLENVFAAHARSRRGQVQQAVAALRADYPAIAELRADWLQRLTFSVTRPQRRAYEHPRRNLAVGCAVYALLISGFALLPRALAWWLA